VQKLFKLLLLQMSQIFSAVQGSVTDKFKFKLILQKDLKRKQHRCQINHFPQFTIDLYIPSLTQITASLINVSWFTAFILY
jgi:hypothetical protein